MVSLTVAPVSPFCAFGEKDCIATFSFPGSSCCLFRSSGAGSLLRLYDALERPLLGSNCFFASAQRLRRVVRVDWRADSLEFNPPWPPSPLFGKISMVFLLYLYDDPWRTL